MDGHPIKFTGKKIVRSSLVRKFQRHHMQLRRMRDFNIEGTADGTLNFLYKRQLENIRDQYDGLPTSKAKWYALHAGQILDQGEKLAMDYITAQQAAGHNIRGRKRHRDDDDEE